MALHGSLSCWGAPFLLGTGHWKLGTGGSDEECESGCVKIVLGAMRVRGKRQLALSRSKNWRGVEHFIGVMKRSFSFHDERNC